MDQRGEAGGRGGQAGGGGKVVAAVDAGAPVDAGAGAQQIQAQADAPGLAGIAAAVEAHLVLGQAGLERHLGARPQRIQGDGDGADHRQVERGIALAPVLDQGDVGLGLRGCGVLTERHGAGFGIHCAGEYFSGRPGRFQGERAAARPAAAPPGAPSLKGVMELILP